MQHEGSFYLDDICHVTGTTIMRAYSRVNGVDLATPISYYQKLIQAARFVSQVLNPHRLLKYSHKRWNFDS